jgi:hypothetical protein
MNHAGTAPEEDTMPDDAWIPPEDAAPVRPAPPTPAPRTDGLADPARAVLTAA